MMMLMRKEVKNYCALVEPMALFSLEIRRPVD